MLLQEVFEQFYFRSFGDMELLSPLFYKSPIAIRFEIGDPLEHNKARYIENTVYRAYCIFQALFQDDDNVYVVVDSLEARRDIDIVRSLIHNCANAYHFAFCAKNDEYTCERHVMKVCVADIDVKYLLEEIAWSDIDGKRTANLASSVYVLNPRNQLIYYLYDDRGLDVVASSKIDLQDIYNTFHDWILEYDRKKIDKIFAQSFHISGLNT